MYYIIYAIPSLYIKVYIFDLLSCLVFIHFTQHTQNQSLQLFWENSEVIQYIKILQI